MKSIFLPLIFSALSVMADQPRISCGFNLVNSGDWTQSDIAKAACGRTDTCNGQEWNTLFETLLMSSGPSSWVEIKSTGVFCDKGCYGDINKFSDQCH